MKKLLGVFLALAAAAAVFAQPALAMSSAGALGFHGADISRYQMVNGWAKAGQVLDFLYIRAGYGGAKSDSVGLDVKLASHVRGARSAGLSFGFYWFFRPSADTAYIRRQAQTFYASTKSYPAACRPALDVEMAPGKTYTLPHFSAGTVTDGVKIFAAEYRRLSGKTLMIYASPSYVNACLNSKSLAAFFYWAAHYTGAGSPRDTTIWHTFVMWQYTSHGSVAGIGGRVDLDRATYLIFWPSDAVKRIQRQLNTIGYKLAVNGLQDGKTTAAVKDMQRRNGLSATGTLTDTTKALIGRVAAQYAEAVSHPSLRRGSRGSAVRLLQRAMNAKDQTLDADGVFGPKTLAAVEAFQRGRGLRADGVCGPKTWAALAK